MAGIYLHIPFCRQACNYCNFHFSTSLQRKNDFVAALLKETALQSKYLDEEEISTIYFGGGTPSLLEEEELNSILQTIHKFFSVSSGAEITLEANPDDIHLQNLGSWRNAGINRLSIGVQSFIERDLKWMNRAHHAQQSVDAIHAAKLAGFENLTIDLIYGLPDLTNKEWEKNIDQALTLEIPHLSCYALTQEPKTLLDKQIRERKSAEIDPEIQAAQFLILIDKLESAGYEHYEISNFSKPGKRSRHNSAYWQGKKYLGLGPSAHSYNGTSRQWNISNNSLYIKSLDAGELPFESEMLSRVTQLNEYLMISLRTAEGCNLDLINTRFGSQQVSLIRNAATIWVERKKLKYRNGSLVLTKEGKLFADGIAADLFLEESQFI